MLSQLILVEDYPFTSEYIEINPNYLKNGTKTDNFLAIDSKYPVYRISILPNFTLLQICNFWLKTPLTEMALAPLFLTNLQKKLRF